MVGDTAMISMMRTTPASIAIAPFIPLALLVLGIPAGPTIQDDKETFTDQEIRQILTLSPVPQAPFDPTNRFSDSEDAARVGQFLFFDSGLSGDGSISCATCHDPARAFTDGRQLAEGAQIGVRNAPTLLNVAHNRWFFWDGRADSLWSQALAPLESSAEMAGSRLHVFRYIRSTPTLRGAYERAFGGLPELPNDNELPTHARPVPDDPAHEHHVAWNQLTVEQRDRIDEVYVNVGKSIAAYEQKLLTGPSRFDQFVAALRRNDKTASDLLSVEAQRGLGLFIGKANCRMCHNGPLFSDLEFHNVGVPTNSELPADAGRYDGIQRVQKSVWRASGTASDRPDGSRAVATEALIRSPDTWGQFRTPSLRNVAWTAPYMHQGQFADLRAVLHHYSTLQDAVGLGHHQEQILKPLDLSEREINDLVAFLESLTGTLPPESLLERPDLQFVGED